MSWIASQLFFVLPALGLLALAYWPRPRIVKPGDSEQAFARRYVTMLAFGPFLFVTLSALVARPVAGAIWGYPLCTFMPLAALVWFGPVTDALRQRVFAAGVVIVFAAFACRLCRSGYRSIPCSAKASEATDFPGKAVADQLTKMWREQTQRAAASM